MSERPDRGARASDSLVAPGSGSSTPPIGRAARATPAGARLRVARSADVPVLEGLIARAGTALSAGFYTPAQALALTRHVFGVDSQLIADRTYFVCEQGGVLVACGGWSRRRTLVGGDRAKRGADPLLDPTREAARIRAFFVAPEQARRGFGRRLLEHCVAAARAGGFRRLELVATLPGEPLYAAGGFVAGERFELLLPDESGGTLAVPVVKMVRVLEAEVG
jgi:GNAT superfamily N-acetyltransferase